MYKHQIKILQSIGSYSKNEKFYNGKLETNIKSVSSLIIFIKVKNFQNKIANIWTARRNQEIDFSKRAKLKLETFVTKILDEARKTINIQ
jgi:hypothetical protein